MLIIHRNRAASVPIRRGVNQTCCKITCCKIVGSNYTYILYNLYIVKYIPYSHVKISTDYR